MNETRIRLALKVDVDTDRGTREGVPNLVADLSAFGASACFLFSLGPDQTGRALRRVFRPGFLGKVSRTNALGTYGLRTLLNGTLLPSPHIARRNADLMRRVRAAGFEVGVHCYNHVRWQDGLERMTAAEVTAEFKAARDEFRSVFDCEPTAAGAAGWQSNALSRQAYDEAGLLYSSDTRGVGPYFPRLDDRVFKTLEIPTTLPTLDEWLGRPEYPESEIAARLSELLRPESLNVFTLHAEIEGMRWRKLFRTLLAAWRKLGVEFVRLEQYARDLLTNPAAIPVCEQVMAPIDGRSGVVATQRV